MKNKQSLTLIKLGGSIITHKDIPMSVRTDVLEQLVEQIARAHKETGKQYIVGHGQGSFAHAPAARYKTIEGFIHPESKMGMAITQDSAAQLNRIVVSEFLRNELPAVSYLMSNVLVTDKRKKSHWDSQVLESYLNDGLLPITGGDVLGDTTQGCTIWSTEQVLALLADAFFKHPKYQVKRVIHVAEVAGVLDAEGAVVPHLTHDNWPKIKKLIGKTKGFDVTGGMGHKIEESLQLADSGVEVRIISGLQKNSIYSALVGQECGGTVIG